MKDLTINTVENGFVVYESMTRESCTIRKQWVFNDHQALAEFICDWAHGQTKTTKEMTNVNK